MKRSHARWPLNLAIALVAVATLKAGSPHFYQDDPLLVDAEDQDASRAQPDEVTPAVTAWQAIRGVGDRSSRLAMNVNSIGEVPDSSWFTNRIGHRHLSIADISRGPDTLSAPPSGPWTVVAGKTDGITPGLQLTDSAGRRFFVKVDPPSNPEMASGAEVVATKLLFALGYHVPENYIANVRREELSVGPGAAFKGPDGKKRPMTPSDIDRILQRAARNADGTYRVLASLSVEGKPLGPFQYTGTRATDPNDNVPHEHRRELRGLRVFAAWLNHVDTKGQNSLDTLVRDGERSVVRHHLIDFGSALGSAGTEPKDWRDGYEYGLDKRASLFALLSVGTYTPKWLRIDYPELPAVGRIEGDHFQPERWKPTLPNPAFQNARADDTFWAAQRVMAFSDDAIRAAVATARFSDPAATRYLGDVLIKRRDQVGRTWLTNVNPIVSPSIDRQGLLTFRNAAVAAGVATEADAYHVIWAVFDNATGARKPVGRWASFDDAPCRIPAGVPGTAEFVTADIDASHPRHPSWANAVRAYFRRDGTGAWTLVGFERLQPEI